VTDERLAELREAVAAWQSGGGSGVVPEDAVAELLAEVDRLRAADARIELRKIADGAAVERERCAGILEKCAEGWPHSEPIRVALAGIRNGGGG